MAVLALLTRVSPPPSRSPAVEVMSSGEPSSMISAARHSAVPPAARISSATASSFFSRRPTSRTAAPDSASPREMPRPTPWPPPVTIATLPARRLWRSAPAGSAAAAAVFCWAVSVMIPPCVGLLVCGGGSGGDDGDDPGEHHEGDHRRSEHVRGQAFGYGDADLVERHPGHHASGERRRSEERRVGK